MTRTQGRARGAVAVAFALMAVAAVENTVAPWAPFYVVYAALTLVLPFVLGAVKFERPTCSNSSGEGVIAAYATLRLARR